MKSVAIILVNWNGWQDTVECLKSLEQLDYPHFCVVVDNASTNDSVRRIRAAFPHLEIIEASSNGGFAAGCNAGIRFAFDRRVDYVWLLNNDTTVDHKALCAMVEKAESDPKVGAVGSAIYDSADPEKLLAWGGGYINFVLGHSRHFTVPVKPDRLHFVTGASLLLRSSAIESCGLLDESFFMYWEDADYCFRLRRAGWRLAVAGDCRIWHKEQSSVGKKSPQLDSFFNRSARRFFARHSPAPLLSIWTGLGFRILKRIIVCDWKRARAVWRSATLPESSAPGAGS